MKYLLDTNHWSELQRGNAALLNRLRALPADSVLFMPVVAQAELLAGVESFPDGKRKSELRRFYESAVAQAADVLPIDSGTAEAFARIFAQLKRAGRPIDTNDMWVGAIAMANDLIVASADAHLREIAGLRVEDWTAP